MGKEKKIELFWWVAINTCVTRKDIKKEMSRRLNNKDNSILSQKMVIMNHESGRKAIDQISKLLGGL